MNRRSFLALASGLLVPEPVRAYSFVGGWNGSIADEWRRIVERQITDFRKRGWLSEPDVSARWDATTKRIVMTHTLRPLTPARLVSTEEFERLGKL